MSATTLLLLRRQMAEILTPALGADSQAAARSLLCDFYSLSLTGLVLREQEAVSESDAVRLLGMARRVSAGEPVQYVSGRAEFCGLDIHVEPGVLIPRPETEQLVEWVAEDYRDAPAFRLMDVGTGSGCIALSLCSLLPSASVTALDVSADALRIARGNARRLGLDGGPGRMTFVQADILAAEADSLPEQDVVVSNPPYVLESERATMERNVLDHEPATALFVPDADPLLFYRRIARLCLGGLLSPGGSLYFEINERFGPETAQMLVQMGFEAVEVRPDYLGKPRMAKGRRPGL